MNNDYIYLISVSITAPTQEEADKVLKDQLSNTNLSYEIEDNWEELEEDDLDDDSLN